MNLFFLQTRIEPPTPHDTAVTMGLALIIPAVVLLVGTVLGFSALADIRRAGGRLGGAVQATFAAGFVPAAILTALCGGVMTMVAGELSPAARRNEDLFGILGAAAGLWLSFLMLRRMYRQATGWVPPAEPASTPKMSGPATAALILTILGGLLIFTYISRPDFVRVIGSFTPREMVLLNLAILTGGLICGVIARAETTGKVCAWICGGLFLFLVLAHT